MLETIEAPATQPDVATVPRNPDWEWMVEQGDLAASFWRSFAEAAWRGDVMTAAVHLRQARLVTFAVVRAMEKIAGNGGAA